MKVIHLYQRTLKRKGKSIKAWYYWFYDDNGNQIRKSCGSDKIPCLSKKEAQQIVANLTENQITYTCSTKLKEYCQNFYDDDSDFMLRMKEHGKILKPITIQNKKRNLNYILGKFGNYKITELKTKEFDKWLLHLDISSEHKNRLVMSINEILNSLHYDELIPAYNPVTRYKSVTQRKKGILYFDDIYKLFPSDYDSLMQIWGNVSERDNTEYKIYQFACAIYLIITTGMRNSEVRALQWDQIIRDDAIIINAMIDSSGTRTNMLKKGDDENKKWRVVVIPTRTTGMLQYLKILQKDEIRNTNYVFENNGKPYSRSYLNLRLHKVLEKNGIDWKSRNITLHSLRFTYNTLMKKEISGNDLRRMMGHVSEKMTDYYDRSKALDYLPELLENKEIIDSVFK